MQIPYDITYIWNLIYGTNEPIYRKETNSWTWRTDCGCQVVGGVGWTGSLGMTDYTEKITPISQYIDEFIFTYL